MHDPIPALKQQVAGAIKTELVRHNDPMSALLMETTVARVSNIRRGHLRPFSLERLIRYAERLGVAVELRLKPRSGRGAVSPDA